MSKITKEEFNNLPTALKESFTPDGEEYVLKTEDVSGLKSALKKEREAKEAAEKLAKNFEGLNAEEIRKMISDRAKAKEDEDKKAGKFDEILRAKEDEWKKQFDAEKLRADTLERNFVEKQVESVMVSSLSASGVIPERLDIAKRLMRDSIEYETRDGNPVLKFKDETGYAQEMKPDDFTAKWREKHPYFFQSEGKEGSGDRNGGGNFGNGKVVKANDQAALSANLEQIASGEMTVK